jgi:membrane protein implicated in regulation of membrane protease activity
MPPQQQPTLAPSPVEAVQIVTLTVYSSGSSTQSGLPALSSGGGASVPSAAIVGGVVGGVALAVLLVIIWNYWGRKIKRTERQRRKEIVRSRILFGPLLSPPASSAYLSLLLFRNLRSS